jgi:hypothetical protein
MADELMNSLQKGINDRQAELRALVSLLGAYAYRLQRISNWLRILTILLSAITTAKGVADQIYGEKYVPVLVTFTILGIFTTVAIGVEAAFKFEKRAADLSMLAATTQSTLINVDSEWRKNIGSIGDSDLRKAAGDLITTQDAKLTDVHQKAAAAGLNLTLERRDLEAIDFNFRFNA